MVSADNTVALSNHRPATRDLVHRATRAFQGSGDDVSSADLHVHLLARRLCVRDLGQGSCGVPSLPSACTDRRILVSPSSTPTPSLHSTTLPSTASSGSRQTDSLTRLNLQSSTSACCRCSCCRPLLTLLFLLSFTEHTARDLLCRSGSLGTRRRNQHLYGQPCQQRRALALRPPLTLHTDTPADNISLQLACSALPWRPITAGPNHSFTFAATTSN
jgi:hypothetical protein